jgi:uncharacterized protein
VDPGIHERQAAAPAGFADVIGALVLISTGETPRWHVTFTVADRDDSAATAERLGATVVSSSDNMWTRDALVRDPQGAEFTVSQFSPPGGKLVAGGALEGMRHSARPSVPRRAVMAIRGSSPP